MSWERRLWSCKFGILYRACISMGAAIPEFKNIMSGTLFVEMEQWRCMKDRDLTWILQNRTRQQWCAAIFWWSDLARVPALRHWHRFRYMIFKVWYTILTWGRGFKSSPKLPFVVEECHLTYCCICKLEHQNHIGLDGRRPHFGSLKHSKFWQCTVIVIWKYKIEKNKLKKVLYDKFT